ncbi:MAG TPA: shikimate dehydrogenase [Chloroflexia bacterium]|nr:shikimate dehydrogenase [Chloroflexia bacterium]
MAAEIPPLRVGLIGHPLGHSLSPAMQDAAFVAAGLPHRYTLFDTPPVDLPALLAGMREGGWLGANVTVPHKTSVAALLDDLRGDALDLGAVNTVQVEGTRLLGYNTDTFGFADDLAGRPDLRSKPGVAVVLGAGGSARAVVATLVGHSWEVHVLARDLDRASALARSLPHGDRIHPDLLDAPTAAACLTGARLLVNCTPVGMWPHVDADPLPAGVRMAPDLFVYDLVYRPYETRLLARAAAAGCRTTNGLPMLVAQGAAAFTIWTGLDAPRRLMRSAAEHALLATGDPSP